MPVLAHAGGLHVAHFSVAPGDFPQLLRAHRVAHPETDAVEENGRRVVAGNFEHETTLAFVERVMNWGRGERNASRVLAQGEIATACIANAHRAACDRGAGEGLAALKPIKHLGLAFASKVLRFLLPGSAVILDSVIRENLGYPNSQRGYQTFLAECHELLDHVRGQPYPLNAEGGWRVSDIEAAIYARLKGY